MKRLIGYAGMIFGSVLGWWLGKQIGFFAAFLLGVLGAGAGLYFTRRLVRNYFD